MSGKVLLNVYSIQVKNDLLSIFVENGYEVFETMNENDLLFKHHLIRDSLEIYVHELNESNYEASLNQLKRIDREKVRCIVMIHKYNSHILDDALALKVKDVIVLPMDRKNLTSKLIVPTQPVKRTTLMPKEPPETVPKEDPPKIIEDDEPIVFEFEEAFDHGSLEMELNRSTRGKYPLSLVMVSYSGMTNKGFQLFEEGLRHLLRTTDAILRYDKGHVLLLCPFTTKENLVEVKNKVRSAHQAIVSKGFDKGLLTLSGVTYPRDATKCDQLLKLLKDQLEEEQSAQLEEEKESLLKPIDDNEVRNRLRKNY